MAGRICMICGEQMLDGMTDLVDFYTHEGECFEKAMDSIYGKHCWMMVNDDGEDGYYLASDDSLVGGCFGTGIFYTDWFDEEDEDE